METRVVVYKGSQDFQRRWRRLGKMGGSEEEKEGVVIAYEAIISGM